MRALRNDGSLGMKGMLLGSILVELRGMMRWVRNTYALCSNFCGLGIAR